MADNYGMGKRNEKSKQVILVRDHDPRVADLTERGWRIVGWVDGFYRLQAPRTAARGHQTAHSAPNADSAGK